MKFSKGLHGGCRIDDNELKISSFWSLVVFKLIIVFPLYSSCAV